MVKTEKSIMKYLSVCSGIEAATSAWHPLGWEPVAFAEIEPFPSAVLKHHYPDVPNLGDMSKFKEWNLGTIDLLVGGTPCQSFSVAGLRKGLDDPRGNLMLTFGALARHFAPRWLVWENVPGVLSSNGGRDFGTFLGMLGELGYGFAYRVLDAQYFGVAQRRRRVFVVGCLGDWRSAAAVLFELASMSGNPAPSREARKGATTSSQPSPTYGGSNAECADTVTSKWAKGSGGPSGNEGGLFVAHTLRAKHNAGEDGTGRGTPLVPVEVPDVMATICSSTSGISRPGNATTEHETYIPMAFAQNTRDEVRWVNGDGQIVGALAAETGMKQTTYVAQPIAFSGRGDGSDYQVNKTPTMRSLCKGEDGHQSGAAGLSVVQPKSFAASSIGTYKEGVGTLRANGGDIGGGSENLIAQPIPLNSMNCFRSTEADPSTGAGIGEEGEAMFTLTKTNHHAVAQPINIYGGNKRKDRPDGGFYVRMDEQTSKTLDAASGLNPTAAQGGTAIMQTNSMAVRRLTPVECERLQGFPDNHTAIPWRGKDASQCPDGPRYKALGNSMAVPVMAWIGQRIEMVNELQK